MHMLERKKDTVSSGGIVYFQNSKNTEITELQAELNSMKLDQQKDAMKQIIASMTIGKDVSALFPHVVKCMRTTNVELKKLIYLYIINYAKAKPDLTFLAVAAFNSDAMDKTSPLIRALAVRTMGCIRVNMIVSYLCETLTHALKDEDAYVRKTAATCVAKLYITSPGLVNESGFITTLNSLMTDGNANVVANALASLLEISVLSGENLIKIRSKTLKRVLQALGEANEWGQVYILDALTNFTPKKPKQADDIIEHVLPRLAHNNPAVVMSAVKVVLKFLDRIESAESVRNYCKKLSNSLMSIMSASPEIQYVLLRSLHAVVQKRPLLLDKDFKFFFVQYNDPVYVKLEKIDILYKLCDNKNYESIMNEFKSYAIMEFDNELVKKSIRYIGYIGFKYEKSVDLCVECLSAILDHSQESTVSEGIIVARDIMRKYKGRSLELLKKIDQNFISGISDGEALSAILFILGEFCLQIKNSTSLISSFVENFSSPETSSQLKLQILNAVVKNYVQKPDETEEIVKECLRKGAEESENPDVRDRAYIFWRLLETDPDLAKEMVTCEKPSFDFIDDSEFDTELADNIIENMTNVSAVYHKTATDLIPKADMVIDESLTEDKSITSETKQEEKPKAKKQTTVKEELGVVDIDLLGLDEDAPNQVETKIPSSMSIFDDIFGGPTISQPQTNQVKVEDFGFVTSDDTYPSSSNFDESKIKVQIFSSSNLNQPTPISCVYKNENVTIYTSLQREDTKIQLGLFLINKTKTDMNNIKAILAHNSFGLTAGDSSFSLEGHNGKCFIVPLHVDNSRNDKNKPGFPYKIGAKLTYNDEEVIFFIPFIINVLFIESGKMQNKPFVEFFQENKDKPWNNSYNTYENLKNTHNEDALSKKFERNNIFLVAKQTKFDPPLLYYSCNISGAIPVIIECSYQKGTNGLKLRIMTAIDCLVPLVKEAIDLIVS